ncbi:LacI family DNA-binding transcriptional regulator [Micromonospora sp. NPDC049523]|uniref:LacI family DNA-binding transcriptional regulator n=1 Tax=Micromonospora sp. NPDC049523 TaxID=3155921 RepID=UPI00343FB964
MERRTQTLADVARAAGVSRSSVSRVINREPGVAPEVRQRVEEVISTLGYRPNPVARALATGSADVVELVVVERDRRSFGANPHYGRVVAGILEGLADTDVQLRINVVEKGAPAAALAVATRSPGLGSVLVNVSPALAEDLSRDRERMVSMGRSAPGIPSFTAENENGVRSAIRHLYALGRRRIAAIHGPMKNPCAVGRRDGYFDAIAQLGLTPITADGDFSRETGAEATRRLLATHPDLDAIFCACDQTATGALQVLMESGRRVPDDVALVGFDDSVLAAAASPPLTSVHQPVEQIAASATRLLLQRRMDTWQRDAFPTALAIRKSSAG